MTELGSTGITPAVRNWYTHSSLTYIRSNKTEAFSFSVGFMIADSIRRARRVKSHSDQRPGTLQSARCLIWACACSQKVEGAAVSSTLCNSFLLIYCLPTVRATETFAACMKRNYRADSQREGERCRLCTVTAGEIAATTVVYGEEENEGGWRWCWQHL